MEDRNSDTLAYSLRQITRPEMFKKIKIIILSWLDIKLFTYRDILLFNVLLTASSVPFSEIISAFCDSGGNPLFTAKCVQTRTRWMHKREKMREEGYFELPAGSLVIG